MFIIKIKWVIQLPFIGSESCVKKLHGDKVIIMQLVGLVRFVSSDKYHSFGRNPWGIPNPASILSAFFYIGGPHPPEHRYQWVNDACQLNLFALPVCHQRHGELKLLLFFQNDHKSSHQLSSSSSSSSLLWSFWEMCRESRIISSWNQGCSFHQCWLPFLSRVVTLATHRTSAVGDE